MANALLYAGFPRDFHGLQIVRTNGLASPARWGSSALFQDLERQRLKSKIVAGIEQHGAVRDGDDLRHERLHDHVVARLSLGRPDLPHAVCVVSHRHEDIEASVDIEAPAVHAVAANRCFEVGLAVRGLLARVAVASRIQMLAAIAAAAIVLAGEVLFDLPHPPATVAVEHVRGGQLPIEIDRTARMHREQFADVVPVERDQIGDLLALGLGELEPLSGLDLEADVSGRRESCRFTRFENGCCTVHVRTNVLRLTAWARREIRRRRQYRARSVHSIDGMPAFSGHREDRAGEAARRDIPILIRPGRSVITRIRSDSPIASSMS